MIQILVCRSRAALRGSVGPTLVILALLAGACAGPPQDTQAKVTDTASGPDTPFFDTTKADAPSTADTSSGEVAGDAAAAGQVTLTFEVDDSANKTFADGEIVWTGSFSWDEKSNSIVYATSWLPTDGPYPPLYDDGPYSAGGHEREGAVQGDHIFSTQVTFATVSDTTIEYGALNELGNWMWNGANGQLQVKKGLSGVVAVPGMILGKHGDLDMKVTLDTAALHACCTAWTPKDYAFYLKGTMNMWTPIQLLDNGQKGDAAAGDGILTYVHKLNLGKHDGGLMAGEQVQFIFVTTKGDQTPDGGAEYKAGVKALAEGVQAWTNTGVGGAWESVPVVLSKDSKGKVDNTGIVVPKPQGGASLCDPVCKADEVCDAGTCKSAPPPTCDPACGADQTCDKGVCVAKQPAECTPACGADKECTAGVCVAKPVTIVSVEPSKGETSGGTAVTITGSGFAQGAKVLFDSAEATDISTALDGLSISCKSPAHAAGLVAISVENPGGAKGKLADAFSYQLEPSPSAELVLPGGSAQLAAGKSFDLLAKVSIGAATAAAGVTPDLQVWLGTGPVGAAPATSSEFTWTQAQYGGEGTQGDELWSAQLAGLAKGSWQAAVKVEWKSKPWFGGSVTLQAMDPAELPSSLDSLSPPWSSAVGGSTVKLVGANLPGAAEVAFLPAQGTAVAATSVKVVDGGLEVVVPALPLGLADVTCTIAGKPVLKLPGALHVVPFATPVLGGDPAQSFGAPLLLATNGVATSWGEGKNELKSLWLAWDANNLYIGVAGTCEATNAITAFVDVDYGAGVGAASPAALGDSSGAVDDALASALTVSDGQIGLDFAFATIGMASFLGTDLGKSLAAGWRSLANASDLGWVIGDVAAGPGKGVEAVISLKALYPNGIPKSGATLKIAVALGNDVGGLFSNAFLPEQAGQSVPTELTTWATATLFPVEP